MPLRQGPGGKVPLLTMHTAGSTLHPPIQMAAVTCTQRAAAWQHNRSTSGKRQAECGLVPCDMQGCSGHADSCLPASLPACLLACTPAHQPALHPCPFAGLLSVAEAATSTGSLAPTPTLRHPQPSACRGGARLHRALRCRPRVTAKAGSHCHSLQKSRPAAAAAGSAGKRMNPGCILEGVCLACLFQACAYRTGTRCMLGHAMACKGTAPPFFLLSCSRCPPCPAGEAACPAWLRFCGPRGSKGSS